jgi:hypothetical protein
MTEATYSQPLPGRHVGEVRDPELIGTIGTELPVDAIQRSAGRIIGDGRAQPLATPYPVQALCTHQAFDYPTSHYHAFTVQLPPDLIGAVDMMVFLSDPVNERLERLIAQRGGAAQQ